MDFMSEFSGQSHSQLKHSAEDLVRLLQKSESLLDAVARKLDDEFATRYQSSGLNPVLLSKRINHLAQQIPAVKADCQALIQRKQELIDTAKQQLLNNRSQLQALSARCGLPTGDDAGLVEDFKAALEDWDRQAALQNTGGTDLANNPSYLSREELNYALAGSMLGGY